MIKDYLHHFTTIGTPFAPTATGDNIAPNSTDLSPLGLPTGSGGGGATGYNSGSAVNAGRDLGIGTEMWLYVLVTTTVTSGGSATVKFDFVTDSVAALSNVVDSTGVGVLLSSPIYPKATLVAQFDWMTQLPAALTYKQYIGLDVVIAVAVLTAGAFEAALVPNIQQSDQYLSGFAIQ